MKKVRAGSAFVAVAMAVFFLAASGESNEAKKADDGGASSAPAEGASPEAGNDGGGDEGGGTFVVGDLVELGDWTVQVHAVTDPLDPTNDFMTPPDGERWVAIDAEVSNQGDGPKTVSSLMCFELQDGTNRSYSEAFTGENLPDLGGEVAGGAARRGTLVYAVPVDATGLRLNFKCDLLSSGTATIDLG